MRGHSSTNEAVHVVPIAARQLGLGAPAGVPGRNVRKRRGDPDSPVRAIRLKGDGVGAIIFQYCILADRISRVKKKYPPIANK